MSSAAGPSGGGQQPEPPTNLATAVAEVSERASKLVREEIELAKAELEVKATNLAKGTVVGVDAGDLLRHRAAVRADRLRVAALLHPARATTSRTSGASSRWP